MPAASRDGGGSSRVWQPAIIAERPATRDHAIAVLLTAGMLLYTLVLILDPSRNGWGTVWVLPLKYGGAILAVAALFFVALGGVQQSTLYRPILFTMAAFFFYQMTGSIAALVADGPALEDTFLGRGLSGLAAILGLVIGSRKGLFERLAPVTRQVALISICGGVAFIGIFELGLGFGHLTQILHIELYFLVAAALWLCARSPEPLLKWVFAVLFLYIALASGKATAYLLLALYLMIAFVTHGLHEPERRVTISPVRMALFLAAIPITLSFAYLVIRSHNTINASDLRFHLWQVRFDQFLASPLFGRGFTGSPMLPRPNLPETGVPTHNDYLDILAEGGLLGFVLFAAVLVTALRSPLVREAVFAHRSRLNFAHYFAFLFLAWGVASLGNPVFAMTSMAVPTWFAIGVLCARPARPAKPAAP
ncbi:O-antigen ligase family protein [Pelagibacterium lacus]|uniref:O-antigen ligase family protein n=1 Tax=Pelagibacterium lacus TaxID=2282655 RepID=UPI001314BDA1|nr:O-antigen ligase family protein [Pelagibacterium lacus]